MRLNKRLKRLGMSSHQAMKKTLTDIVEALNRATDVKSSKDIDTTFGFYMRDGKLSMGFKAVQLDDTEYKFTPGLRALITLKQPQSKQWNSSDYREYKNLVAQTRVGSFPDKTGNTRTHAMWKWKQLLNQMVIPVERIPEEGEEDEEEGSRDTDDADTTSSVEDPGESSHMSLTDMLSSAHTRSHGKANKHNKSKRFTLRRYKYGGSGIVSTIGSLLARYATKAMLSTVANTAMRGTLDSAKRAVPH